MRDIFYPGMFNADEIREVKRSKPYPLAYSMCNRFPELHILKVQTDQETLGEGITAGAHKIMLSDTIGNPLATVAYAKCKSGRNRGELAYIVLRHGWRDEDIASTNLNYVLRKIAEFDFKNAFDPAGVQERLISGMKAMASSYNRQVSHRPYTTCNNEVAALMLDLLNDPNTVGDPAVVKELTALQFKRTQDRKKLAAYHKKVANMFGQEKWFVVKSDNGWVVGVTKFDKVVVTANRELSIDFSMPIPMRLYKDTNSFPKEWKDDLLSKLVMLKMMRGENAEGIDADKLMPSSNNVWEAYGAIKYEFNSNSHGLWIDK